MAGFQLPMPEGRFTIWSEFPIWRRPLRVTSPVIRGHVVTDDIGPVDKRYYCLGGCRCEVGVGWVWVWVGLTASRTVLKVSNFTRFASFYDI